MHVVDVQTIIKRKFSAQAGDEHMKRICKREIYRKP